MLLISLDHAFLYALGILEAAWDVSAAERLGLLDGEATLNSWYAFGREPTGPALKEALESLASSKWLPNIDRDADHEELALYYSFGEWPEGLYQSGRLPKKTAQKPAFIVPRVPSGAECWALIQDSRDPNLVVSDHERRLVEVINFFQDAISSRKLVPVDNLESGLSDELRCSRPEVEPISMPHDDDVVGLMIDFRNNLIHFENDLVGSSCLEFSNYDRKTGIECWVDKFSLHNLIHDWLDEAPKSDDAQNLPFEIKFTGKYYQFAGDEDKKANTYEIYLAGSSGPLSFDFTGKPGIEMGFMAIDFLNRNRGVEISHQLLSRLTWFQENQKVPFKDNEQTTNNVSQKLKEIGIGMYREEIGFQEAHRKCAVLLSEHENKHVRHAIPHTPEFGKGKFSQYKEFEYRKSNLIKKIQEACDEISKTDARGKKIAEYIKLNLRKEAYYLALGQ